MENFDQRVIIIIMILFNYWVPIKNIYTPIAICAITYKIRKEDKVDVSASDAPTRVH